MTSKYALHKAVIRSDADEVTRLLEGPEKVDIDERDARGIPAIQYAIHLGNRTMVQLLLSHGADPARKSAAGWNPMQEAIAASNRPIVKDLLIAVQRKINDEYEKRLPALVEAVTKIPDFYMELKWEFHSWVPLVSRLCPYDTYKIYKRGACFRVDTTLVGFENMKWIRGDVSFIFRGENGGNVYIVDHKNQTVEKAFSTHSKHKDYSLHPDNITDQEIKRMMSPMLHRTLPVTDNVAFTASKTWLGYEKTELIGDDKWKAKIYEFDGFDVKSMNRKKTKKTTPHTVTEELRQEFIQNCDVPDSKPHGLIFPNEEFSEKSKSYKGTIWLSEEFPRTVEELLPIFETLAPSQKHFDKLNKFISLKMPSAGFPVKLDIPVFPTITASVTFLTHQEEEVDESKFEIPPSYKQVMDRPKLTTGQSEKPKSDTSNGGADGNKKHDDNDSDDELVERETFNIGLAAEAGDIENENEYEEGDE